MDKLVSIIVPAYNVAPEIGDCIRSVQQQTYPHWELIVVNDESKDNTEVVVEELMRDDSRIRLVNQENGGVSKARNTGLSKASGVYIAFLDGDDMWEPTFLDELIAAKEKSNVDMVYCGYSHLYTSGLKRGFSYPYSNGHILMDVINKTTHIHIGAILVDRSFIAQMNLSFTEGCLVAQDQEFIKKLVSRANVQAVPKELMIYRIRSGSAVRAKWNWEKHIHGIHAFRRAAEFILAQDNPHYDKQQLIYELNAKNASNLYKLLWRMIKHGYQREALTLMDDQENAFILSQLDRSKINLLQRVKYWAVRSRNNAIWRLVGFL
ncbi:glycosyltransferase family 2 protein [Sporomusa sp. KB1]|uniref:glycosyltransferase family 2 protein n=1 Tax=Sporomusa sp. KB1 TaxID=943346 RepID=UPI0011AC8500|nr:glycosyltransferase family 2 protein [Sporomusa sp. KB1]TWH45302.1 UDP-glucose:(glucosyl)LPS beta-1,3-glucosyltransferase [Sporomusa sp. KB1]